MPYSIKTKDGIILNNIPDEIDRNSEELKQRVFDIRKNRDSQQQVPKQDNQQAAQENNPTNESISAQSGFENTVNTLKQKGRDALNLVDNLSKYAAQGVNDAIEGTARLFDAPFTGGDSLSDPSYNFEKVAQEDPQTALEHASYWTGSLLAPSAGGAGAFTKALDTNTINNSLTYFNKALRTSKPVTIAENSNAYKGTKEFIKATSEALSEGAKDKLAKGLAVLSGSDPNDIKRILDRGPDAFRKEYLNKKAISKNNFEKSHEGLKRGFDKVRKSFEESVAPDINDPTKFISNKGLISDVKQTMQKYSIADIDKEFIPKGNKGIIKSSGDGISTIKRVPREYNQKISVKNAFSDQIEKDLRLNIVPKLEDLEKNPSAKIAHNIKKQFDNLMHRKIVEENPAYKAALGEIKTNINARISQVSELYLQENAKYEMLYSLMDDIGSSLTNKARAESYLLNVTGKGKTIQQEALKQLDDFLPKGQKFYDGLMDELSSKALSRWTPAVSRSAAVGVQALAFQDPVSTALLAGGTSPRAQTETILLAKKFNKLVGEGIRISSKPVKKYAPSVVRTNLGSDEQ